MARGSKSKAKPSKDEPKPVMIRVPHDWLEVLEAAQFVRRKESMQALLEDVLGAFLAEVKNEPETTLAMKSRTDHDARRARSVARIKAVGDRPEAERDTR